jgi:fucose permease
MYTLLISLIYIAFVSLGLPDSLLGAGWPSMHLMLDVPLSSMGIVSMIISGGTILSSLLSDRILRKFSTVTVTAVSTAMTAVALFGFSVSTQFWMLCMWAIPYGLGAGAIDAALNHYVALHYTSRHMNWLHCFWGAGAMISPYFMTLALTHTDKWQNGYLWVSLIQIAIAAILFCSYPLWKINKAPAAVDEQGEPAQPVGMKQALKRKGLWCVLIGFFAYCAAEATAMLWTSSYLLKTRGISEIEAAACASLFFIGITGGRFLAGFISNAMGDLRMIRVGTAIAAVGLICMALPVGPVAVPMGGAILFGLGCAPIYPAIIHATPALYGERYAQAIIGIQMASAYTGSTFMPPVLGYVSGVTGLEIMPYYMMGFFILMIVMVERAFRCKQEN